MIVIVAIVVLLFLLNVHRSNYTANLTPIKTNIPGTDGIVGAANKFANALAAFPNDTKNVKNVNSAKHFLDEIVLNYNRFVVEFNKQTSMDMIKNNKQTLLLNIKRASDASYTLSSYVLNSNTTWPILNAAIGNLYGQLLSI